MAPPIPDEQAALLAAICAEPDDDTPRLVYADWLQEHGDEEQAQFIRDSIALSQLADDDDEMAWRLSDIIQDKQLTWLAALGISGSVRPFYGGGDYLGFDRGMVEELIYNSFAQFLGDAATLFARTPVRAIEIEKFAPDDCDGLAVLADTPDLLKLRELRLSNRPILSPNDGFTNLVTSPYVANLEVLAVNNAVLTDNDMHGFNESRYLTNLEILALTGNRITVAGALTVVRSSRIPRLRQLGLANNPIESTWSRNTAYGELVRVLQQRFGNTDAL